MVVKVHATFTPLRMILKRREPIEFKVTVVNQDTRARHVTLKTALSNELAFDRGGLKASLVERVESLKPKQEKTFYYQIFPKVSTNPGSKFVRIQLYEHGENFSQIHSEKTETLELQVE